MNRQLNISSLIGPWKTIWCVLVCSITLCISGYADEITPSAAILRDYYETVAERLFLTKELPGNLEQSLEYYLKASQFPGDLSEIEWKITRCYWVLATKTADNQKRSLYFKKGVHFGKEAVKNDPKNSYAHSWLALIIGSSAMDQGIMKSIYNREIVKSGFETAIRLDPENTNAYVGLAAWYFHVPAIFGGNKEKAYQLIDQAIPIEPNYTAPRLYKAEFLISDQRKLEAITTLKKLLSTADPLIRGDGTEDKIKARKLLQKLESENQKASL